MTIRAFTFAPFPPVPDMPQRTLCRRARPRLKGEPEALLLTQLVPSPLRFARRAALALGALVVPIAAAATIPAFGAGGDLTFAQMLAGSGGSEIDIFVPPAMPVELVAATRGEQGTLAVAGQEAQAMNAALPFWQGPLDSARPFLLASASAPDQSRALHCLTQAVYYEAANEPLEGRRAVAQVVLNRVRHPAFPNSVCGVVYDGSTRPGCQFSFTCDGSLRRTPSAHLWGEAQEIARAALQGQIAGTVGTATHYHANYVSPYWAPRLTKLAQVGAHIFYRWPGNWGRTGAFTAAYNGVERFGIASTPVIDTALAALPTVLSAPDPTDRRAPEDVGGRLDVTRGWTLRIPSPEESRSQYSNAVTRQAQASAAIPGGAQ